MTASETTTSSHRHYTGRESSTGGAESPTGPRVRVPWALLELILGPLDPSGPPSVSRLHQAVLRGALVLADSIRRPIERPTPLYEVAAGAGVDQHNLRRIITTSGRKLWRRLFRAERPGSGRAYTSTLRSGAASERYASIPLAVVLRPLGALRGFPPLSGRLLVLAVWWAAVRDADHATAPLELVRAGLVRKSGTWRRPWDRPLASYERRILQEWRRYCSWRASPASSGRFGALTRFGDRARAPHDPSLSTPTPGLSRATPGAAEGLQDAPEGRLDVDNEEARRPRAARAPPTVEDLTASSGDPRWCEGHQLAARVQSPLWAGPALASIVTHAARYGARRARLAALVTDAQARHVGDVRDARRYALALLDCWSGRRCSGHHRGPCGSAGIDDRRAWLRDQWIEDRRTGWLV